MSAPGSQARFFACLGYTQTAGILSAYTAEAGAEGAAVLKQLKAGEWAC